MTPDADASPSCAIVVLNWNGRQHLADLLPSLYDARTRRGGSLPIVVVDNRSTADDVAWLGREHPTVEVVVAPTNDFLFSLNPVVVSRSEDVVVVLNNDMRVDPDFLAPLLAHFGDPAVFAVTARTMDWDGASRQNGQRLVRFRHCWCYHWFDRSVDAACYTAEAGGGCSAYRRTHFAALSGFDPLYRPAYWEDFDLSYRAWMRGWSSLFEPASIIYHRGSATLTETLPSGRMGRVMARNQLLFVLSNVAGWGFVAGVLALLPYRLLVHAVRRDWPLVAGQLLALPRLGAALGRRWRRPRARLDPAAIVAAIARPVTRPVAGGAADPGPAARRADLHPLSLV